MFDSAADKYTSGGRSWDIDYYTDKIVNGYNHIKNEDDPIIHNVPIVGAYTIITPPNGKPFMELFHQMTCN